MKYTLLFIALFLVTFESMASENMEIKTLHIELGVSVEEGLEILKSYSLEIEKETEGETDFYKISFDNWEAGFYSEANKIIASWYNDPTGRDSDEGINTKVAMYLSRYGKLGNWERGLNNGWIQFFINKPENVNMAYGLHKDVIRFNLLD